MNGAAQRAAIAACLDALDPSRPDLAPCHAALRAPDAPCARTTRPGHFTASTALVIPDTGLVMIHHRALGRWLLPGGHIDPGETPQKAARRELAEETGISLPDDLHPSAFGLDCHPIPANPAKREGEHDHYDLRFLFVMDEMPAMERNAAEVEAVRLMSAQDLRRDTSAAGLGDFVAPFLDALGA